MQIEVRHAPSFAVARVRLGAGEAVRAESGAMMATSAGIGVEAKAEGGLFKGLKRSVLGGESLFITRFSAGPAGGWVDLGVLPGEVRGGATGPAQGRHRGQHDRGRDQCEAHRKGEAAHQQPGGGRRPR